MSAMRDISVVKSSVIPSAKYCWSGSLLRLVKGSTTIDRRGVTRGCTMDVAAGAPVRIAVGEDLVAGQNHQGMTAMTTTAAAAAAIAATALRRRRGDAIGPPDTGSSAMASWRTAKTRTGRAMFLTFCSPLSSNG